MAFQGDNRARLLSACMLCRLIDLVAKMSPSLPHGVIQKISSSLLQAGCSERRLVEDVLKPHLTHQPGSTLSRTQINELQVREGL